MPGRVISVVALVIALAALTASGDLLRRRRPGAQRPGRLAVIAACLLTVAALAEIVGPTGLPGGPAAQQSWRGLIILLGSLMLLGALVSLARRERPIADDGTVDPLTRVATHRAFQDRLLHECERAYRFGDSFALLLLDIDQFQLVNNRYSHTAGDRILVELSRRLRGLVRDIDLCARFGGDQFAIILPHTLEHGGVRTAERVRKTVAGWTFLTPGEREARLTASIGLAYYPEDGRTPPQLVDAAKRSVRFAKSLGGNQVQLFREMVEGEDEGLENVVSLANSSHGTIVRSLAAAVDARDRYTHSHSNLVSELSAATARKLGLRGADVGRVRIGGLLHDVGKIGIPDAVLSKEGPLTQEEWSIVRRHPVMGKRIIEQAPELRDLIPMVLYHQERYDGSGYPDRLVGEDIPLEARIVAAADAYHAIRSDRPYRSGRTHQEAVQELLRCAGTQFDPRVVSALVAVLQTEDVLRDGLGVPQPIDHRNWGPDPLGGTAPVPIGGTA